MNELLVYDKTLNQIEVFNISFSIHVDAILRLFCSLAATNHELLLSSRCIISVWDDLGRKYGNVLELL